MKLPEIKAPEYPIIFPLSKRETTFRPYNVENEKILLAAAANRQADPDFYVTNTVKVIKDCVNDQDNLIETLPAVDVDFLLLQLRAKSVGETVEFDYADPKTKKTYPVTINLENFKVNVPEDHEYKIQLTDQIGVTMRDLKFSEKISYSGKFNDNNKTDVIYETIVDCIQNVYDGDQIWVAGSDVSRDELKQWIGKLTNVSNKLYKFVATMPFLEITFDLPTGKQVTMSGNDVDFLALSPATST